MNRNYDAQVLAKTAISGNDADAAAVTIAAAAGQKHRLIGIHFAYDGDADGFITIALTHLGSALTIKHWITKGGPGQLDMFDLSGDVNTEIVVTQTGVASTKGSVTVYYTTGSSAGQ